MSDDSNFDATLDELIAPTSEPPTRNMGGWNSSKLFKWQAKALFVHLSKQEKKWRKVVEAKVKTYTPEEIVEFAKARGELVAPSVLDKVGK